MLIRKAKKGDETGVLALLSELNPIVNPNRWNPFFDYYHGSGDPYFGFVLDINSRIEGFIGTVIADRQYGNDKVTCCNIHGWIVRDNYKSLSLKLLTEVLKEDMVFTCFSAMELTQLFFKRMKFFYLEHDFRIYRPKISFSNTWKVRKIKSADDVTDIEEKKIVSAHVNFKSEIIEISKKERRCLIIFKPEEYCPAFLSFFSFLIPNRYSRLLKSEYISEHEMFYEEFKDASFSMLMKLGAFGFILPADVVSSSGIEKSKKYFGKRPYMYRFDREKYPELLPDTLFSEMFVLNHKG